MRHLALRGHATSPRSRPTDEFLFGPDLLAAPVVEPGAKQRALYVPAGRWVDWWRSVRYRKADGSFHARGAAAPARRCRADTLPAPLGELPLLARAGSVLPLLSADVDTLAPYGDDLVHLRDRRGRLACWPSRAGAGAGRCSRASDCDRARFAAGGGWTCRVSVGGATGSRPRSERCGIRSSRRG